MGTWSAVAVFSRQDLLSERQVYRSTASLVAWWAWTAFAVVLLAVLACGHHDHAALVTAVVVLAITGIMYRVRAASPDRGRRRGGHGGEPAAGARAAVACGDPGGLSCTTSGSTTGSPPARAIVHSWAVQSSGRSRTRSELRARRAARRETDPEPGYARLPGGGPGCPGGLGGGVHRPAAGRAGPASGVSGSAAGRFRRPPGALGLGPHGGDGGSVAATGGRDAGLRPAGGLAMRPPAPRAGPRLRCADPRNRSPIRGNPLT